MFGLYVYLLGLMTTKGLFLPTSETCTCVIRMDRGEGFSVFLGKAERQPFESESRQWNSNRVSHKSLVCVLIIALHRELQNGPVVSTVLKNSK